MARKNYYARDCAYGIRTLSDCDGIHVFSSREERDVWVEDDDLRRESVPAREAIREIRRDGSCVLHDDADFPRAAYGASRIWEWEDYGDDAWRVFDLALRYA